MLTYHRLSTRGTADTQSYHETSRSFLGLTATIDQSCTLAQLLAPAFARGSSRTGCTKQATLTPARLCHLSHDRPSGRISSPVRFVRTCGTTPTIFVPIIITVFFLRCDCEVLRTPYCFTYVKLPRRSASFRNNCNPCRSASCAVALDRTLHPALRAHGARQNSCDRVFQL